MSEDIRVSVIVPTYNRQEYLPAAVASLLAQTSPPHEVLIVNDGSDYDVAAHLAALEVFPSRVINIPNGGKPGAVNAGVAAASGTHIWVFDDDDIANPGFLEEAVRVLSRDDVDYVYGWHYAGKSVDEATVARESERRPAFPREVMNDFQCLLWGCSIAHNATIARARCYKELGGIDPSYPCSEDYEFQLRLSRAYLGAYVDAPAFTRRLHEGARGAATQRYLASERRQRFLEQDRRFIGQWLDRLSLEDYPALLPAVDGCKSAVPDASPRARYLFAFAVAARAGLWGRAIEFLDRASPSQNGTGAFSDRERDFIRSIVVWADQESLAPLLEVVSRQHRSSSAISQILRGAAGRRAFRAIVGRDIPQARLSLRLALSL